ncbi:MAG: hypothetical protein JJU09_02780 [Rhodobacteraceae bacterium]|nr:hypothetical protein [Paracoccaceae bacterium]
MDMTTRKRWIANLVQETQADMPALPWTRAAKRQRRLERAAQTLQSA